MTEPLTADDLARMREEHTPYPNLFEGQHGETGECSGCNGVWPCDAVRLCDEVERLRGDVQDAAAKHVCACTVLTYPQWQIEPVTTTEIARFDEHGLQLDRNGKAWIVDPLTVSPHATISIGQSEAPTVSDGGKE